MFVFGNVRNVVFCSLASCRSPQVPVHGSISGTTFGHGGHVTFSCDDGFRLLGSTLIVCDNGRWSAAIPKCKGIA